MKPDEIFLVIDVEREDNNLLIAIIIIAYLTAPFSTLWGKSGEPSWAMFVFVGMQLNETNEPAGMPLKHTNWTGTI